ncbi:MAG: dihydrofolate reductase, partial [Myxococcota bacterium]
MRVSLVVAAARNGAIGLAGKLPWRLPDDQRFFKELTLGHCVVMGRKTFDSLPGPLPNRKNLILSRQPHSSDRGADFLPDLTAALDWARAEGFSECFIAGGEAVYREGMASANRVYLTRIDAEPEADTYFPELDETCWRC